MCSASTPNPKVKLTPPPEWNLRSCILPIGLMEFNLTWMQFLQNYKKEYFQKIQEYRPRPADRNRPKRYVIMDSRRAKEWQLTDQVAGFINSFARNNKQFSATIALTSSPKTPAKATPGHSRTTSAARPVTASTITQPIPTSSAARGQPKSPTVNGQSSMNLRNVSKNAGGGNMHLPMVPQDSDMFSMLSMDSQDSQEDLIREGVDVTENIFHTCVGNFQRRLDNNTLLRMRLELQRLHDGGKWMRVAARLPITANALQQIFNIV